MKLKSLLTSALIILLMTLTTWAAPTGRVGLAWDPNPPGDQVETYHVFERLNVWGPADTNAPVSPTNWVIQPGGVYVPLATTTNTSVILTNVTRGFHAYVVTASNIWGMSEYSQEIQRAVNIPESMPSAPSGIRIDFVDPGTNVTSSLFFNWPASERAVGIQHSPDGVTWHPWLTILQQDPDMYATNFAFSIVADRPQVFWRRYP